MPTQLSISRLINVSVNLTPAPAQAQNLSTLLILGTSTVIDVTERMRSYDTIEQVAAEFGSLAEEYLTALLWFQQAPQPSNLLIGRWAKTAAAGQLIGGTLSAANQAIAGWNAIANGSVRVTVDGAIQNLAGLDFTAAANLNAVAAIIDAALAGATVVYDANFTRFVITSATTGAASTVAFLLSTGAGTDIRDKMSGTSVLAAYRADGIALEAADTAVALFDSRFGQQWYAVQMPAAVNADTLLAAAYIEAATNKHLLGVTTQEAGVLSSVDATNIAYQLKQLEYKRTFTQYSSSNPYAVASAFGRALTVDYDGNSTVITLMYKQEPGIAAESLNSSQIAALEGHNANVFVAYNNDTAILEQGVVASGDFLDIITGTDWLSTDMQTALYNLLYTSPTKIPQTDAGTHLLTTTIEQVCAQGVVNGLLAPGTWQSAGFGTLKQGDLLDKGYYIYASPLATQNVADRAARKAPPIQCAVKLAGAVHSVDVAIAVNR